MRLAIPTVVALLAALAVTAATEEAKPSAVSTGDHSKHDWPWHKDDDKKSWDKKKPTEPEKPEKPEKPVMPVPKDDSYGHDGYYDGSMDWKAHEHKHGYGDDDYQGGYDYDSDYVAKDWEKGHKGKGKEAKKGHDHKHGYGDDGYQGGYDDAEYAPYGDKWAKDVKNEGKGHGRKHSKGKGKETTKHHHKHHETAYDWDEDAKHGWEYGKNEAYGDSYQGYGAEAKRERAKKGGYRALTAYDDEYHAHNGYEEARGYGSEEKGAKAWKGKGGRKDSYYGAEVKREHEGYYGEQGYDADSYYGEEKGYYAGDADKGSKGYSEEPSYYEYEGYGEKKEKNADYFSPESYKGYTDKKDHKKQGKKQEVVIVKVEKKDDYKPRLRKHTPKKQETKEQHEHEHYNVAGKMKEGARNFKDTAKGAWDYGTAKTGEIAFGKWGGKNKGGDDESYYGDNEAWAGYGYGSGYGRWPDEDSYGGGYDWDMDKEWQKGSKWEGDYY